MKIFFLLSTLPLLLSKFNFWKGDWALGYIFTQIWVFRNISLFPKIVSLQSFGNLWGNSYTKFAILDITLRCTCDELDLYWNILRFQNIMTIIVGYLTSFMGTYRHWNLKWHNFRTRQDFFTLLGMYFVQHLSWYPKFAIFCKFSRLNSKDLDSFIKILVILIKSMQLQQFPANNLVLWQKLKTNKAKKSPKLAERWVYEFSLSSPSIFPEF